MNLWDIIKRAFGRNERKQIPENTTRDDNKYNIKTSLEYITVDPKDLIKVHHTEKPTSIKPVFEIPNDLLGTVPEEETKEIMRRSGLAPLYGGITKDQHGSHSYIIQEYGKNGENNFVILRGKGEETYEILNQGWVKYTSNSRYDNNGFPLEQTNIIIDSDGKLFSLSMCNKTHKTQKYYDKYGSTIINPNYESYEIEMMKDASGDNPVELYSTDFAAHTYDTGEQAKGGFFIQQTIEKDDSKVSLYEHYEESDDGKTYSKIPFKIRLYYLQDKTKNYRYDESLERYVDLENGEQYTIEEIRNMEKEYGFNLNYSDKLRDQFGGKNKKLKLPIPPVVFEIVKKYKNQIQTR